MRSLIAVLCYASIAALGGPAYSVQVIQAPSGAIVTALQPGINNSGQMVGTEFKGAVIQAFIASPSLSADIPLPSGWNSAVGVAINSAGQIAGYGQQYQAFIGTTSGSTPIQLPAGWGASFGAAINDSGQVAGTVENLAPGGFFIAGQAFVGNGSGSVLIPLPSGWSNAIGQGMNKAGQVTGYVFSPQRAFIGTVSGSVVLPLPPGWFGAVGNAINDSGQVAGYGTNAAGNEQALIGTVSSSTAIPLPPGANFAEALSQSIDNAGMVVGFSDAGGWIWDATHGTRLLNGLVPSGWSVSDAISISNTGLILAQAALNGGAMQYVELVPATPPATPAPAPWMLLVIGLAMLPVVRRFSRRRV